MTSGTQHTGGAGGPLRIAVAGAGKMAQHHARAIARVPSAELLGIADPSPQAREAMAGAAPGCPVFASVADLLRESRVDVLHVCTPPAIHAMVAEEALQAGCHVYVEKPFAETVADAGRVLDIARSRGRLVCAGHQLLFEPPAQRAARLRPAIGRLTHIESYFSFRTVRRSPDGRVPLRADFQLLDILPHPVYLLLSVLGAEADGPVQLMSLELGEGSTVHALVRRGSLTGVLTVTLEGRPVESYLRLVGTNGSIVADFVRSTVQRQIGPGTSGIDKLLAPFRQANQLFWGTTVALSRRFLKRQRSYPGLVELFTAFYDAIRSGHGSPVSPDNILETVRICERVAQALVAREREAPEPAAPATGPLVVVTGGTGFLGKEVVRRLVAEGKRVRVLARRLPPSWDWIAGAEYKVADLSCPLDPAFCAGAVATVHCAAETAGGWEEHQRNSLDATAHVLRAAAAAGSTRFIHVSSLAVLASPRSGRPVSDDSPLEADSRGLGPYVWGKLESERMAVELGAELGIPLKVVRPGALVDYANFDPPGRLGRRIGNFFVAVGSPRHTLGVTDVGFSARTLSWMLDHPEEVPDTLNLLEPMLPTKGQLVRRLKATNPDLTVIWLPTVVLVSLSWFATALQKMLRPGKPAINVAKVFARQRYDTSRIARLADRMGWPAAEAPPQASTPPLSGR